MDRPCAYCKEFGHHIRFCQLLEDKNYRQKSIYIPTPMPTPARKVIVTSNRFANIYSSSDDELEEGEIVEEDRIRPQKYIDIDVSDSESSCEPVVETRWTRSNIKVAHIPIPKYQPSPVVHIQPEYEEPVQTEEQIAAYLAIMEQFKGSKGRSWAEINYEIEESDECDPF